MLKNRKSYTHMCRTLISRIMLKIQISQNYCSMKYKCDTVFCLIVIFVFTTYCSCTFHVFLPALRLGCVWHVCHTECLQMSQCVKLCLPMSLENDLSWQWWHVHILLSSYFHWDFAHFSYTRPKIYFFIFSNFYWGKMVLPYIKVSVTGTYPLAFKCTWIYTIP